MSGGPNTVASHVAGPGGVAAALTEAGWVTDDVLRDEIMTRGELIKVTKLPEAGQLFDYRIIKKVYTELKKSWKPKP